MSSYIEQLNIASDFISSNDNFLIVSHIQPDGDTISSSLALAHLLKKLGKTYKLFNEDPLPTKFEYLPMFEQILAPNDFGDQKFSNIITVDVADYSRAGNIQALTNQNPNILNIDHHPTNDNFGTANLILTTAAATAEIIYDLIQYMNITIDESIATCIYTGILTDTGGFRYSNTSAKVMTIAADLLTHDIKPGKIAQIALESITFKHITALKKALNNLEVVENGLIAWTFLAYGDLEDTTSDDTEGIVGYTRNIEGVEVGAFFKESSPNIIKVGLRSNKYIDVGSIAKDFGGGGHARAAGFTYQGSFDAIRAELLVKIKEAKGWNSLEG